MKIRRRGLPFSLIYWGANVPLATKQGKLTQTTWEQAIVKQAGSYSNVGGRPDEYVVEDWVKSPEHSVPENSPGTFMHSVNAVASRFSPD